MRDHSLLAQLRGLKGLVAFSFIVGALCAAVNATQPLLLRQVLDNLESIQPIPVVLLVVSLVSFTVLSSLQEYIRARIAHTVTAHTRNRFATQVCGIPLSSVDRYPKGDLLARFGDDSVQVGRALNEGVVGILSSILSFIFAFVGMLLIDGLLLVSVIVCICIGTGLSILTGRTLGRSSRVAQDANGELMTAFERTVTALPLLKAYGAERQEGMRVTKAVDTHYAQSMRLVALQSLVKPLAAIIVQLALFVTLGIGVYRVSTGSLTIGGLVAFVMYLTMMVTPVTQLTDGVATYRSGEGAMQRIVEILSITPESLEFAPQHHAPAVSDREPVERSTDRELLCFDEVTYRYGETDDQFELGPITFTVEAGSHTAIVGHSGAGKSTLLSLMERFRSPASGEVRVLGQSQSEYGLAEYRGHFAYIDQGSVALGGTLRENLAVAGQTVSDDELLEVLSDVGLAHLMGRLDLDLGDAGGRLSGGERQRVAWARLLLNKHRPLLILDEPASSVDAKSAELLSDILRQVPKQSAVILVTHSLPQVARFDQILVLDRGRLVGCGTHDELLLRSSSYRAMATRQGLVLDNSSNRVQARVV